ncbi:uncharacterized protein LY89DRAFT_339322 [Mollisia scopiformis]|uniref:Uncharacterized protein n=1 Tax=Mollisia scopiformis TaxID=149040 RepID=A0A132B7F4_MOLSC|nr:uncharacterized protein LY89DRAFT_339322 [Mollisia scopiformis]KUJ08271.1 hypothetical protein LY89DRAFT_339322 [Mollisia scopiformis]
MRANVLRTLLSVELDDMNHATEDEVSSIQCDKFHECYGQAKKYFPYMDSVTELSVFLVL